MSIQGTIFNIQRHSIHDGPGIRTIVFFKGCPLACLWCSNPESQGFEPELFLDPEKCIACGACAEVCPEGAVTKSGEGELLLYRRELCTACGRCAEVCYAGARCVEGRTVSAREVLAEVLRDAAFFSRSGGGITLSGGEPLAQPRFAAELLRLSREEGLHTAVETAGHVPWENFETVLELVDLFLYDLKHHDPEKHSSGVGAGNGLIISNLQKLRSLAAQVVIRVPVIPGYNDRPEDLLALSDIALRFGIKELHLLPVHRYGSGKYRLLGKTDPMPAAEKTGILRTPTDTRELREGLEEIRGMLSEKGLTVRIGG